MRALCLMIAVVAVSACGGGDGTEPPPPTGQVTSVSLSPSAAQSIQACGTVSFSAQARDADNDIVQNAPFSWTSSDATKVTVSPTSGGSVTATGVGIGSSTVTATSGTVSSNATVAVVAGGASASADVNATVNNTFTPSCASITAGGSVTWTFATLHNVTFSGTAPTGGNIPEQSSGSASRSFPTAGRYAYQCTIHGGMSGVVVVQ